MPFTEEDALYPIAVLIDELKHEVRALSMNKGRLTVFCSL